MIESPYNNLGPGRWLRGNLHTHTTRSDGSHSLQDIANFYASHGYDFLMISDHDIWTGPAEYAEIKNPGLVLIPGNEISAGGVEMLHVNAEERADPITDRQALLDRINQGPGFAVICHPTWWYAGWGKNGSEHAPTEKLLELDGYVGIEVYNAVIRFLDGDPDASFRWDQLLKAGRRVWAFANDDCHQVHRNQGCNAWNMVWSPSRTCADILAAMRAGKFYATTGVTIDRIDVEGDTVTVTAPDAERIVAKKPIGKEFAARNGTELRVSIPEGAEYIRFECLGRGGAKAWTQPFFRA